MKIDGAYGWSPVGDETGSANTDMIRVGKYDYKTKKEPKTEGYANVLIHTTGDLSPYTMKDRDGVIMENYWQFSKVWPRVYPTRQPISRWQPRDVRWQYGDEIHQLHDGDLTPEYWTWRKKGFEHHRWVRYPNGFKNHGGAVGSVIGKPENYQIIGYLEARKRVYFPKYREIAIKTKQFKELKRRLQKGERIQINEVDGPKYDPSQPPFDQVIDGSLEMNPKILSELVNNSTQAFGHGYCLAACLLDIDVSQF